MTHSLFVPPQQPASSTSKVETLNDASLVEKAIEIAAKTFTCGVDIVKKIEADEQKDKKPQEKLRFWYEERPGESVYEPALKKEKKSPPMSLFSEKPTQQNLNTIVKDSISLEEDNGDRHISGYN